MYARAQSATECPDEPTLVSAVAARLGYDPFSPWGDQTILASVSRAGSNLRGRAELIDHDGITQGSREVTLSGVDCGELVLALSLAISITLDPLHSDAPPSERQPEPEPTTTADMPAATGPKPPQVEEPPTPSTRPSLSRDVAPHAHQLNTTTTWRANASALSAYALTPRFSWGARLGLEARRARWSLSFEGWAAPPAAWDVDGGGQLSASLWAGSLAPCFELLSGVRLCAVGSLGSLHTGSQGVATSRSERVLHATAGGRASFSWPLGRRFELLATADVAAVLNRPEFQLDGAAVWRPSPLLATLGIGATALFF
ncbi:MAG TPA: hypothetical protein VHB79_08810 [Polyangiaceae bacterium]|nr:hypothetical protein [Polyangiaceae bacterium]